jgi:hypothetical protein
MSCNLQLKMDPKSTWTEGNLIKQFLKHMTKFLGLHIDNTLSWKLRIQQVLHTLRAACYVLRSVKPYMSQEILKIVYYASFHSAMSYGIIFWGNSTDSTKIFKMQKRAIRIITGSRNRDSCRDLFKNLKILLFHSQYILSPIICGTQQQYVQSDIHNINTRQNINFH